MDGVTRTYSPLRRVLALLHFLTAQYRDNRYAVFTEEELAVALADHYEGGAAARTMRDDIGALKRRGLVVTNLRHPDHVATSRHPTERTGGQGRRPEADGGRARGASRCPTHPWSPPTVRGPHLWCAAGSVGGKTLGSRMRFSLCGCSRRRRRNSRLKTSPAPSASVGSRRHAGCRKSRTCWARTLVDVYIPDRDDVTDLDVQGIELRRYRVNGASHLLETGADLFGLFPYSEVEVMERLTLIADIRASGHPDEVDDRALCSVERKLELWLEHLRH